MDNDAARDLCERLMKADSEREVVALLTSAGLWDRSECWRSFGDRESNFNTIGNQMSSPDAALVEKIVNSIDARLIGECLERGIDPTGPDAPQTIRDAVAMFFEQALPRDSGRSGRLHFWSNEKRTAVARGITVATTGATAGGNPCFTISDCGEGQTPRRMPATLLSLDRSNKLRIPFVQGRFNMGGTGVLKFCGRHNLQLVMSRRNPKLVPDPPEDLTDTQWGFTIVRRESPSQGRRNSVYTYLAPLGSDCAPNQGELLTFIADSMPIFPEGTEPYARASEWGTLVKLYEYDAVGFRGPMLLRDGFKARADILLPEIALPVRLHECRSYRGHRGSHETTLAGLAVRLGDENANLEFPPSSTSMTVAGEHMSVTTYAFKKGKADSYRKNEGVIFTVYGQTHGHLDETFFRRKSVRLGYIADSLLVIVDCSDFGGRSREDLFMNSRDRLSRGELRNEIEAALEDMLRNHAGLRALREARRREEVESRLQDSKPLKETLESILRRSPTLSEILLKGHHITTPFKAAVARTEESAFEGKPFPTFFRFSQVDYGSVLRKSCAVNRLCRVQFETDAVDNYFARDVDRGEFVLWRTQGMSRDPVANYTLTLHNGAATLSLRLPDNCRPGDILTFRTEVNDCTQMEPFVNEFDVTIMPTADSRPGTGGRRVPKRPGAGPVAQVQGGLALPQIIPVKESEWQEQSPAFTAMTALRIKDAGFAADDTIADEEAKTTYDFFVNVDNAYLKHELKTTKEDFEVVRKRFVYGQVLFGMALVHHEAARRNGNQGRAECQDQDAPPIEDQVEVMSQAIAPFLLPIIDSLGSLEVNEDDM